MIQMGTGRDGAAWPAMQSSAARRHLSVPQGETERAVRAEEQVVGGGAGAGVVAILGGIGGRRRRGPVVPARRHRGAHKARASSRFTEDNLFHLATVTIME